jgi:hypothetical protein
MVGSRLSHVTVLVPMPMRHGKARLTRSRWPIGGICCGTSAQPCRERLIVTVVLSARPRAPYLTEPHRHRSRRRG